jgi:hypothetical protein
MPNPCLDEPASQSPPETPPQTLAQIVEKLRIKALHLRAQALEATDPARRKLYETGAVVYEKWAERMQSVLETARQVERTTAAIN